MPAKLIARPVEKNAGIVAEFRALVKSYIDGGLRTREAVAVARVALPQIESVRQAHDKEDD